MNRATDPRTQWLRFLVQTRTRETVYDYTRITDDFQAFIAPTPLLGATAALATAYLDALRARSSQKTTLRYRSALRSLSRWLHGTGVISTDWGRDLATPARFEPHDLRPALDEAQLARLDGLALDVDCRHWRDHALVVFLLHSGVSPRQAVQLHGRDVRAQDLLVSFGAYPRTQVRVDRLALEALAALRAADRFGPLFRNQRGRIALGERSVHRKIAEIGRSVGIDDLTAADLAAAAEQRGRALTSRHEPPWLRDAAAELGALLRALPRIHRTPADLKRRIEAVRIAVAAVAPPSDTAPRRTPGFTLQRMRTVGVALRGLPGSDVLGAELIALAHALERRGPRVRTARIPVDRPEGG